MRRPHKVAVSQCVLKIESEYAKSCHIVEFDDMAALFFFQYNKITRLWQNEV